MQRDPLLPATNTNPPTRQRRSKEGCRPNAAAPGRAASAAGAATQTPLQRYTIALDSGDPILVDPSLYGACLRLPLKSCKASGTQGLEFVLKGRDGAWLLRQHGNGRTSNFFMDLPRVA